jgi:geranylgeranylglycerol-phosphate geranylgeranyltransferase
MFLARLALVRPLNCAFTGAAVLIGGLVAAGGWSSIGWDIYALAFAVAALVAGGGNAINDYFDRDIDRINRPNRPIPSGKLRPEDALTTAQMLFVFGILLSVFLRNPYCFALAGLNSLVLTLYAGKLKRMGLPGNITIGYLVGSTFLFGGLATGPYAGVLVPTELLILVLMAALSTIGRELIKGVQDMRGDRKLRLRTFPLTHGARKAAVLAAVFILTAVFISPLPYILGIFGWAYLVPLALSVLSFLFACAKIFWKQTPSAAGKASRACKVGMGWGLIAFLVGTLSL